MTINHTFGKFGGMYAPEILIPALEELEQAFITLHEKSDFIKKLYEMNRDLGGRPSPLFHAKRLTEYAGGAQIYFKREDLLHGGAHKINNVIGQGLLCKYLGKSRIIAETGAGQHGVATAIVGAALNLETVIYMGEVDIQRQQPNVRRMKLLGANVIPVTSGSSTLKDAVNEALRAWISRVEDTYYLIGSVVGPAPFPYIVRYFQSVIGYELKEQCLERFTRLPDIVIACIGGGSNAAGTFFPLINTGIKLIGVEAAGGGEGNSSSLSSGRPGIFHGSNSYVLQNDEGQILEAESLSAGLDYPGIGPEHAYWMEAGLVSYSSATDLEAVDAFRLTSKLEGIIPALESSHAIAKALEIAKNMNSDEIIVITLSGRGDKDIPALHGAGLLD